MTEWIEKLRQWVAESDNMVFFGGAGVSTESGIPDFRSVDGLYHQKFQYPPETILSHSFYVRHKAEFYDFYRAKMLAPWAQPNAAHRKLAQWEQEGKLKAVITQNIDGLHQKAGSRQVLELHGSVLRNYCEKCGAFYGLDTILSTTGEQAEGSVMLDNLQLDKTKKYAIVMGNEVKGVQQNVVDNCDICIEIPQYGTKHSLNVSVTTGIVIWDFFKQLSD